MSVKTDNFINQIGPLAELDMQKTGVLASLTIAQAILESGWGESELTLKANNLFGIKASASWKGATYTRETREYVNNEPYTVTADFKSYNSWNESISDHSALLQNARYSKVLEATNYKVACEEVYKAGYATDPNYPTKLIKLIEQYHLHQYDSMTNQDYKVACEEVYKAGYATDPNYPTKLIKLIEQYHLHQYDSMTNQEPKSETGLTLYYRVVVGSYANRANAEAQQAALKCEGFESFLVAFTKDGVDYLRVVVGSYTNQENALNQQAKLKAKGFDSFLVAEYI